jgi:hypothetical protein
MRTRSWMFLVLAAAPVAACGDDTTGVGGAGGGGGGTSSSSATTTSGGPVSSSSTSSGQGGDPSSSSGGGAGGDNAGGGGENAGGGGENAGGGGEGQGGAVQGTGLDACPGDPYTLALDDSILLAGTTVGSADDYDTCNNADPGFDAGEMVYRITLEAAGSVEVSIEDDAALDANLVVRTVCETGGADRCSGASEDTETLKFDAPAGDIFVFVDAVDGEGAYELSVRLTTPACGDGILNAGEECDFDPPGEFDGCTDPGEPGECTFEDPDPVTDVCPGETIAVPAGASMLSSDEYTNVGFNADYESLNCNFFGGGRDRVFNIMPEATGNLRIRVGYAEDGETPACEIDPGSMLCWDQVLYARTICDTIGSEIACSDIDFGLGEEITIPVVTGVPVAVIVDAYYVDAQGPFNLHFQL